MLCKVHLPVMIEACLELLLPCLVKENSLYLDATLGLAGHARAVLERANRAYLYGFDRDPEALDLAAKALTPFASRVRLINDTFDRVFEHLPPDAQVSAALFDLGVSSWQIDSLPRGFSYSQKAPLDMRMGLARRTAAEILNTYSASDLERIFRDYGQEVGARRLARQILRYRQNHSFESSDQLVDLINQLRPAGKPRRGHPAKRVFQALRIEVNEEIRLWSAALPRVMARLRVGGRLVVLSYHSLEDTLTKKAFTAAVTSDLIDRLPYEPQRRSPRYRLVGRGLKKPSPAEIARNSRAKSAVLRAIERVA